MQNLFFATNWCHKRLKSTIDLLFFYREQHEFLESDLWKCPKKLIHFTTDISMYLGHRRFEVLWTFILHILQRFVLSLKNSHYAYIPPYMPKSLPTLENEKGQ